MKLVPFSAQYLRLSESLPFGLRDSDGRLLLAGGQTISDAEQLDSLKTQQLFADEAESAEWNRRLAAAMDAALRNNEHLGKVAAARPDDSAPASTAARPLPLGEQWETLAMNLDTLLRAVKPGAEWQPRLFSLHAQARGLAERRLDGSLYHLIYTAGHSAEKYSSHHALLTMLICEQMAPMLQWTPALRDSVGRAALLMNVAMTRLQDLLATSDLRPTPEMRREIEMHAGQGASLLAECGLADRLCIEAVRHHHDADDSASALAALAPELQLARVLRRVDIFGAKMSRRQTRHAMSPVQAAGQACLGPDGKPDEVGSALLKAVGLYPPGSFVQLVSGEVGIVISRGRRANLPLVASLVSAGGTPLGEPALRDTLERRHAVRGAVLSASVRVRPPHERLLALR